MTEVIQQKISKLPGPLALLHLKVDPDDQRAFKAIAVQHWCTHGVMFKRMIELWKEHGEDKADA